MESTHDGAIRVPDGYDLMGGLIAIRHSLL
jgi:hypothetical protein